MKLAPTLFFVLVAVVATTAQIPSGTAKTPARATVDGIVTRDPGGEPVKKALIEVIAENQTEGGDYTAVSGTDGTFHIGEVLPGRYHLFIERPGFLQSERGHAQREGRVLTLAAGQEIKDLHIRLQAAAVVRGRVSDEDGDPLPEAQVAVLRQSYSSGHNRWEQAGAERTNDLGEYRIANLAPGNYYISVNPPPDFRSLIEASGASPKSDRGDTPAATSYQATYYPGTIDRSQAAPIQLHAGDEFPANFSLTPSLSLTIRGSVVNLPEHSSASIMLQSRDFGLILSGAEMHKDGSFVIRDVSPGAYTIMATIENAPVPMAARQSLQVVSSNIEGLHLSPQPAAVVRGRLRLAGSVGQEAFDFGQLFLALQSSEPADDAAAVSLGGGFSNLAHISPDGTFQWREAPPGNYYVQLAGQTGAMQDAYVKSVAAGNRDATDSGIEVNGGAVLVDLTVSTQGAVVEGVSVDQKGVPVANAVIVAVPEVRMRSGMDHYRKTVADQSGRFTLHGIAPGDYTLFAWESVDGEAYYNPEFLKSCEGRGSALHVSEGERKSVRVLAIPDGEQQE